MNIFEIEQDLLSIFDEIEENGGELTSELEEKLEITQENFKNKVESYLNVKGDLKSSVAIRMNDDLANHMKEEEINRLKALQDTKERLIARLQKIILQAVNKFGDTTPKGSKFFDYGTGKVSVRKTQIVDTNDELIKFIGNNLSRELAVRKENNQLNVLPPITKEEILSNLNNDNEAPFGVTSEDLDNIKFDISVEVNLNDILTSDNFEFIKEAIALSPKFKLSSKVSKTELKTKLKENGSCAPNIAALDYSESLTIK